MSLENVKVGDEIMYIHGWHDDIAVRETVTRVTKTQITTDSGNRWIKHNGDRVGGSSFRAKPFDQERWDQVVRDKLIKLTRKRIAYLGLDAIDVETLTEHQVEQFAKDFDDLIQRISNAAQENRRIEDKDGVYP